MVYQCTLLLHSITIPNATALIHCHAPACSVWFIQDFVPHVVFIIVLVLLRLSLSFVLFHSLSRLAVAEHSLAKPTKLKLNLHSFRDTGRQQTFSHRQRNNNLLE